MSMQASKSLNSLEIKRNKIAQVISRVFQEKCLQEEFLRFLAISAEMYKKNGGKINIPPLLMPGFQKHKEHLGNNFAAIYEYFGLPECPTNYVEASNVMCEHFSSLYGANFGYPLNSQVYAINIHLRERAVA